jgi:hypothetical protein
VLRSGITHLEGTRAHSPKEATFATDDDLVNPPFIPLAFDGKVGKVTSFQEAEVSWKQGLLGDFYDQGSNTMR